MNLEGDWTLLGVGSVCFDAWWLRLGSLLTVPVPGLGAFIAGVLLYRFLYVVPPGGFRAADMADQRLQSGCPKRDQQTVRRHGLCLRSPESHIASLSFCLPIEAASAILSVSGAGG